MDSCSHTWACAGPCMAECCRGKPLEGLFHCDLHTSSSLCGPCCLGAARRCLGQLVWSHLQWCFPVWMSTAQERGCRSWEKRESLPGGAYYSDFPLWWCQVPLLRTLTHTAWSLILGSCFPHMAFVLWEAFRHITLNLFILTHFLAMLNICF